MYEIEWSEEAKADLRRISAFARGPVMAAILELRTQAERETRNRKPLREPLEDLPEATWQVRIGDHRALYRISHGQTARILRVILKGTATTWQAVAKGKKP
jgi:mRNA-degrading endonuclease RelE of RelBE toxin-antitoxin system